MSCYTDQSVDLCLPAACQTWAFWRSGSCGPGSVARGRGRAVSWTGQRRNELSVSVNLTLTWNWKGRNQAEVEQKRTRNESGGSGSLYGYPDDQVTSLVDDTDVQFITYRARTCRAQLFFPLGTERKDADGGGRIHRCECERAGTESEIWCSGLWIRSEAVPGPKLGRRVGVRTRVRNTETKPGRKELVIMIQPGTWTAALEASLDTAYACVFDRGAMRRLERRDIGRGAGGGRVDLEGGGEGERGTRGLVISSCGIIRQHSILYCGPWPQRRSDTAVGHGFVGCMGADIQYRFNDILRVKFMCKKVHDEAPENEPLKFLSRNGVRGGLTKGWQDHVNARRSMRSCAGFPGCHVPFITQILMSL
ncbi:hypothetical protein DFH07DRAFT_782106 [Mycena maculata]|uniref:Uncharacterized protein n=1 Tax=Mycena maculata TaxID=230809 RepID=A0AAD7HUP7_9AGAR|nr:hypothetical protein DFH07DRAFT_782106 [Mycena maculata]